MFYSIRFSSNNSAKKVFLVAKKKNFFVIVPSGQDWPVVQYIDRFSVKIKIDFLRKNLCCQKVKRFQNVEKVCNPSIFRILKVKINLEISDFEILWKF